MMTKPLKIFWLSAELAPLVKVGGLGDVAGALPKAFNTHEVDIRLCLPYYSTIKTPAKLLLKGLKMSLKQKTVSFDVYLASLPGTKIPVYLIRHPIFVGPEVYPKNKSFNRFALWSKAALTLITALDFIPDILHLHDWQAGLAAYFLPEFKREYPAVFARTKVLYTIHNLANQGDGRRTEVNPMAEAIKRADYINTVSPTYAQEILTKEFGSGLEKLLRSRRRNLVGILNGIDVAVFDPQTDNQIKFNYSAGDLSGKQKNKLALQRELRLPVETAKPLLAFVARLSWQKGIELFSEKLLVEVTEKFGAQLIFLGSGEAQYENI